MFQNVCVTSIIQISRLNKNYKERTPFFVDQDIHSIYHFDELDDYRPNSFGGLKSQRYRWNGRILVSLVHSYTHDFVKHRPVLTLGSPDSWCTLERKIIIVLQIGYLKTL